jgi:CRP/FNR family cyclic AMP-dependent transcriptional regulator
MPTPQTDLLTGLAEDQANRVMALGTPLTLPSGGVLFQLGQQADKVYLVVKGTIALTLPMQVRGGTQNVLVEERLSGETVGWSGLIPPHRFTLNAAAAAPSEVLALPRAALASLFSSDPALGQIVTRNVASVIGHRLQVFQTMWLREMQRVIELRYS